MNQSKKKKLFRLCLFLWGMERGEHRMLIWVKKCMGKWGLKIKSTSSYIFPSTVLTAGDINSAPERCGTQCLLQLPSQVIGAGVRLWMTHLMKAPPECQPQDKPTQTAGGWRTAPTWLPPSVALSVPGSLLWSHLPITCFLTTVLEGEKYRFSSVFRGHFSVFEIDFLSSHLKISQARVYLTGDTYFNLVRLIGWKAGKLWLDEWWLL